MQFEYLHSKLKVSQIYPTNLKRAIDLHRSFGRKKKTQMTCNISIKSDLNEIK